MQYTSGIVIYTAVQHTLNSTYIKYLLLQIGKANVSLFSAAATFQQHDLQLLLKTKITHRKFHNFIIMTHTI